MHAWAQTERCLESQQAELDLLGYTREEYVGHPIAEFTLTLSDRRTFLSA